MGRITDEDGIDGPFERNMRAAMREDAKKMRVVRLTLADCVNESRRAEAAVGAHLSFLSHLPTVERPFLRVARKENGL